MYRFQASIEKQYVGVEILVPSKKLIMIFDEVASPMFVHIENLARQNEKLRAARDLLLPRLMSGEIAV